jgi:hypothetical protein
MINKQEAQKDIILAYLDREREIWLGARVVACTDPSGEALEAVKTSLVRIDTMLDEYLEVGA